TDARPAWLAPRALARLPGVRRVRPLGHRGDGAVGPAAAPARTPRRRHRDLRGRTRRAPRAGRPHWTLRVVGGGSATPRRPGASLVPVFAVRTGIRRYQIRVVGRFAPNTPAESVAALAATVRAYERLVRAVPAQWLMFEDVWGAPAAGGRDAAETVSPAAALRRG